MEPTPDTFGNLLDALAAHHWPLAAGLLIVFVVYGANRLGLQEKVGPKFIPWVAVGLGILSAVGAQLLTGISWEEAIGKGFAAGATATGLWEMLLKHLLPDSTPPVAVAAPSSETLP